MEHAFPPWTGIRLVQLGRCRATYESSAHIAQDCCVAPGAYIDVTSIILEGLVNWLDQFIPSSKLNFLFGCSPAQTHPGSRWNLSARVRRPVVSQMRWIPFCQSPQLRGQAAGCSNPSVLAVPTAQRSTPVLDQRWRMPRHCIALETSLFGWSRMTRLRSPQPRSTSSSRVSRFRHQRANVREAGHGDTVLACRSPLLSVHPVPRRRKRQRHVLEPHSTLPPPAQRVIIMRSNRADGKRRGQEQVERHHHRVGWVLWRASCIFCADHALIGSAGYKSLRR